MNHPILEAMKRGLIVSCQALESERFFGNENMVRFAQCALDSNAVGIRANTPEDVSAIKESVKLPIIGLWKRDYEDSEVYITPTLREVEAMIEAGSDIVAMDATLRVRPNGEQLKQIVEYIKANYDVLLMADVSTLEEGIEAEKIGFDVVSTTLSGYTPYSRKLEGPDFQLIRELSQKISIPVFGEGRVNSPEEAKRCLKEGAYAVVVGGAITRPNTIVERFVKAINV